MKMLYTAPSFRLLITSLILLAVAPLIHAEGGKSVRYFGAVGDGKADDTAAIQKAVDSGLGSIVLPKGNYLLTKTITVDLDKTGFTSLVSDGTGSLVMTAGGPALHFVGTHLTGSADPKSFQENVWQNQRMPIVRGVGITGTHSEADGIQATGVMQLTVSETNIHRVRHGIRLTTRNRNVLIANCHIYHNTGCGIFYDHVNLHQSNIVGSHISYNAQGGIVFKGGEVRNVHIGTCDIESNMTADTTPTANILIDSSEGSTDEVAITGCTIQHNSKSPGSANIRVLGKGVTSLKNNTPTQEGHITITGNVFSDVMVNIHLNNARGVNITGNTFWEGFEHDLLVENSQCVVVGPNDFDRNPRYVVNGNWSKDLNGLTFRNSADCKLNGLLVKGVWQKPAAVLLEKCDRFTITDCSIFDCDNIGLWLKDCTRTLVSSCVIRDDREGEAKKGTLSLRLEGGRDNRVRDNIVANGLKADEGVGVVKGNE